MYEKFEHLPRFKFTQVAAGIKKEAPEGRQRRKKENKEEEVGELCICWCWTTILKSQI